MRQDKSFIIGGVPAGAFCRGISQTPGHHYTLYLQHSVYSKDKSSYEVIPGNYTADLVLQLPAGVYRADWVETASGSGFTQTLLNIGEATEFFLHPDIQSILHSVSRLIIRTIINSYSLLQKIFKKKVVFKKGYFYFQ